MTAYGSANWTDVKFDFSLALQCAKDLHALAGVIESKQTARADLAPDAEKDWKGEHHDTFVTKIAGEDTDAATMAEECRSLAVKFAEAWADARGEQDRRNFGRYVEKEEAKEDGWDKAGELVVGDDDYGEPPSDPPVPSAPDFTASRPPQHSDWGP